MGAELPLWSVLPFAGILLSIAVFPLLAPHFWHNHFPKISAAWAVIFAVPFLFIYKGEGLHEILHIYLLDYIPFIILLWGLYTIAGGIFVKGTLQGTPATNVLLVLIGTMLASWVGTTGAAMIMIKPIIRANAKRKHKVHIIVFFIFLVANIGGCLTPLGDPPLFLGFLHGVSFFWTLSLFPQMAILVLLLLILLYIWDSIIYKREEPVLAGIEEHIPVRVEGSYNFIFLLGIVGGVLFSGLVHLGEITVLGVHLKIENLIRDIWIILMGLTSLKITAKTIRESNEFSWFPIKEVAYLFAGIFMTIIPALAILKAGESGAMAGIIRVIKTPDQFFWITGALSSFLDNAPTYLTFFNTAMGKLGLTEEMIRNAFFDGTISAVYPEFISILTGVSIGAVFMGANTYIGNAPNFMVKSIAEEAGIKMPSFFGYMFKYSIPILIPLFIIVLWIF
jgi:Na+/H+ antiporter NhaD/arsenite permease-like protein